MNKEEKKNLYDTSLTIHSSKGKKKCTIFLNLNKAPRHEHRAGTWHRRLAADLPPPKAGVDTRLWWTKQHWNRSSSKHFAFALSVSFHIHSSITDVMISETESTIKQYT
jgi:hypothetical protein